MIINKSVSKQTYLLIAVKQIGSACNLSVIVLSLNMSISRLDRTAFKAQTAQQASDHASYYKSLTWQERLRIANYLNSVAYNYPENTPPRLDRNFFMAKGRK
jgi:hypothetical protein